MPDPDGVRAFQAGCRHRVAGRPLPSPRELRIGWGHSALEAEKFAAGYTLTRMAQEMDRGGAAAAAANRETMDLLSHNVAMFQARERLARLIAAKPERAHASSLGAAQSKVVEN